MPPGMIGDDHVPVSDAGPSRIIFPCVPFVQPASPQAGLPLMPVCSEGGVDLACYLEPFPAGMAHDKGESNFLIPSSCPALLGISAQTVKRLLILRTTPPHYQYHQCDDGTGSYVYSRQNT
jgi:hypothetical protein